MPSILNKHFRYVPADKTDISKTFARVRRRISAEAAALERAKYTIWPCDDGTVDIIGPDGVVYQNFGVTGPDAMSSPKPSLQGSIDYPPERRPIAGDQRRPDARSTDQNNQPRRLQALPSRPRRSTT